MNYVIQIVNNFLTKDTQHISIKTTNNLQQFRDLFIRSYTKIGITTQKINQFAERQLETNAFCKKFKLFFAYY